MGGPLPARPDDIDERLQPFLYTEGMDLWQSQGRHRYYISGDVLVYEPHGPHTLDEMRGLLALTLQMGQKYGYVITLANMKDASPDTPEARKLVTDWQRAHPYPTLTIVFGASALMRVASMLLVRASQLINKVAADFRFVAKEEEAWAMVEKGRNRLRASKEASK